MLSNFKNYVVAAIVSGAAFAGSAYAAVPVEVSTALSDAKTDGMAVAGLVLVAVIAMYAFKLMRRGI